MPLKEQRKTLFATSQEAWPEAESLVMKDSLGREPRWNADRCAAPFHSRVGAAAAPARRGRTRPCVCRRFASDIFVACGDENVGTTTCARPSRLISFCESGIAKCEWNPFATRDSLLARFHSSDAKPHRESEILFRHCERHQAPRSNSVFSAALDCFVAEHRSAFRADPLAPGNDST
jgi:hypothetical protein